MISLIPKPFENPGYEVMEITNSMVINFTTVIAQKPEKRAKILLVSLKKSFSFQQSINWSDLESADSWYLWLTMEKDIMGKVVLYASLECSGITAFLFRTLNADVF